LIKKIDSSPAVFLHVGLDTPQTRMMKKPTNRTRLRQVKIVKQ
jgi:hypothetical protein